MTPVLASGICKPKHHCRGPFLVNPVNIQTRTSEPILAASAPGAVLSPTAMKISELLRTPFEHNVVVRGRLMLL